jgi:two-component system chemotaxis response regulator CheB
MSEWPTPVVILSGHTAENARLALTCLEYGAVDFVRKTLKGMKFPVSELIEKVKLATTVDADKIRFAPPELDLKPAPKRPLSERIGCLVIIGASTGGPQALVEVVPRLPADLPAAVIVVQHMPQGFTQYLAERLDARSGMVVREAGNGDRIETGKVLIAPGGKHLMLEERAGKPVVMLLPRNDMQRTACPSVDFAMSSMAPVFKRNIVGIVLTGMGKDGVAGCDSIRKYGGKVICQDRDTSMIFGMPGAVVAGGLANEVVPVQGIAETLIHEVENIVNGAEIHAGQ